MEKTKPRQNAVSQEDQCMARAKIDIDKMAGKFDVMWPHANVDNAQAISIQVASNIVTDKFRECMKQSPKR